MCISWCFFTFTYMLHSFVFSMFGLCVGPIMKSDTNVLQKHKLKHQKCSVFPQTYRTPLHSCFICCLLKQSFKCWMLDELWVHQGLSPLISMNTPQHRRHGGGGDSHQGQAPVRSVLADVYAHTLTLPLDSCACSIDNTFISSRWCLATRKCIRHIGLLLHLFSDQ